MLIKKYEGSLTPFGVYPGARSLEELMKNGIIVIDKSSGPTSNRIDNWVKEILNIKKASHGGTLDPRVSGVLIIALENATKIMPILLSSKKEYVGVINLHEEVKRKDIEKVFDEFVGKVKQIPPKKSAVARRERTREVYYLELLEVDGRNILFKIGTEAGFYVRRFADDVGKKLKIGSHLQELRRTKSGKFTENQAITLQKLIDSVGSEEKLREVILPMELAVEDIPNVVVSDNSVNNICNGSPVYIQAIVKFSDNIRNGDWVSILTLKGELVAIGKANMYSQEIYEKKKGLAIKTDRVLMKKDTYPS